MSPAMKSIGRRRRVHNGVCCECGRKNGNAQLSYRLDPRNWHETRRCLCRDCRKRLGYAVVSFERVLFTVGGSGV